MSKITKTAVSSALSVLFALALSASFFCARAASADKVKIVVSTEDDTTVTAQVGDTVKYSIFVGDCSEEIIGADMSVFYTEDCLELDPDSVSYECFDNIEQNTELEGYFRFAWTDPSDPAALSADKAIVSAEFKVTEGGDAQLSYFITDMYYGDDMTSLKSYKITCSVSVNGKEVQKGVNPVVNSTTSKENKMQGSFINYVDGMGEDNTPDSGSHESVIVEKKYISTQTNTEIQDVTKVESASGSISAPGTTIAVITVCVVVAVLAAAAVIFVVYGSKKKNKRG